VQPHTGTVSGEGSANWSGFQSNTGDTYQNAEDDFGLPVPSEHPPGNTYESSWIGIGTGTAGNQAMLPRWRQRLQAGTETDVTSSGSVSKYAWWEFVPENDQQTITGPDLANGSNPSASVAHTGAGLGGVEVCGVTQCVVFQVSWPSTYTLDTSVYECIAERTEERLSGVWTFPRVTDVTGLRFNLCEGQDSAGHEQYMGNHNRVFIYMSKNYSDAQCLVAPWSIETGAIGGYGSFPIDWLGYGYPIAARGC
jgi:hypothetical protein